MKYAGRCLRCSSRNFVLWVVCQALLISGCFHSHASAQRDPGPRANSSAGIPLPSLSSDQLDLFGRALARFKEISSVAGKLPGEAGRGLGPTYNANSCATCHAEPSAGGSSPGLNSPTNPTTNPQIVLATLDGAANSIPEFITPDGPVREVRFKSDSAVHELFTIAGREDATGCTMAQPNFSKEFERRNLAFRIPTPLFGLGLVENTSDETLNSNLQADRITKSRFGIFGRFNLSPNDGTIARFGWKAQGKSLVLFSGEAYVVEQGVTNEVFPSEREAFPGCYLNGTPEDYTDMATMAPSDIEMFATFMRLTAPPTPASLSSSEQAGKLLFERVGCELCHSKSLSSGKSTYESLNQVTYHPYSDFALHHMGTELADGITQGLAGPDEFRTAPLWGVGQRLYFLHDGRTSNLLEAIEAHASPQSEANTSVRAFQELRPAEKQAVLDFLRTL